MKAIVMRWALAVTLAVLSGGAIVLAQPYNNYCGSCFANQPAWLCYVGGCW